MVERTWVFTFSGVENDTVRIISRDFSAMNFEFAHQAAEQWFGIHHPTLTYRHSMMKETPK